MIKDLVFHIGDPKNGSSSIQRAMQSGACQCETVSIAVQEELNASALANSLKLDGSPGKADREFGKKARWATENDADLGIISAEFFSSVSPITLKKALRTYLPDQAENTRVIAYVRPHAARAVSGFAQRLKVGTYTGKSLFKFIRARPHSQLLRYAPRFRDWQKQFGDRFTLRPFIREELRDQDVVTDFFHHALQGAPFTLAPVENTNESLSLEELAAMRAVQVVLNRRKVPAFLRLAIGGAIGRELAGKPGRSRTRLQLDRKSAELLVQYYQQDSEMLDAQFFDRPLMTQALEHSLESALEQPQPSLAKDYYSEAAIEDLRENAIELSRLVTAQPKAWRGDYQRQTGQLKTPKGSAFNRKRDRNIEASWNALRRIVQIMVEERKTETGGA